MNKSGEVHSRTNLERSNHKVTQVLKSCLTSELHISEGATPILYYIIAFNKPKLDHSPHRQLEKAVNTQVALG